jgi:hypothetical protein
VAAIAICIIWIIADAVRWHRRIAQQWPSWLNAAIPQLEDSSTLLAADAKTPIAKLQQQRLQARLADVLTDADYQAIARTRSKLAILPLALSLLAAARHGPTIAAPPWRRRRRPREANKPIVDGEVHLRVTPPGYTGVAPFETGARDIVVPQFSEIRWCVNNPRGVQPPSNWATAKPSPSTRTAPNFALKTRCSGACAAPPPPATTSVSRRTRRRKSPSSNRQN